MFNGSTILLCVTIFGPSTSNVFNKGSLFYSHCEQQRIWRKFCVQQLSAIPRNFCKYFPNIYLIHNVLEITISPLNSCVMPRARQPDRKVDFYLVTS
jgi:hypothetical protein